MAKTNYTKVEELFDEGLRKILVDQLLAAADKNSGRTPTASENPTEAEINREQEIRVQTLLTMMTDLKHLHKQDKEAYKKLRISPAKMKHFVESPADLTPQDWEELKHLRQNIEQFKKEVNKKIPQMSDEDIVEMQRKAHVNKRPKVNEKWMPLHRLPP